MRSPWGESNYRNDPDDRTNGYDRGGGGGSISHGLLGSLIERSTSAPPMSTESGLSFGDGNSAVSYSSSMTVHEFVFVFCVALFRLDLMNELAFNRFDI